jgi:hypothetical protein
MLAVLFCFLHPSKFELAIFNKYSFAASAGIPSFA